MHRFFIVAMTVAASASTITPTFAQDIRRMEQVAEAAVGGDDPRFMGSVLVARAGEVLFEHSYGFANLEWKTPNAADTKFRLGSVTKQFTAAAVLLLEERGKLKLEDPVSRHIPNTPAAWEKITLFHLLTHTAGLPNFTSLPDYDKRKRGATTPAQTLEPIRALPLDFTPGEKFSYSNSGYILLGQVIEAVSGQSYEAFLTENIFKPLGMADSGYDSNIALIAHRASGYTPGPHGPLNAAFVDMHVPHAAGALYSTPRDLLRWHEGLFGGKLLSAASLEKMTTPNKGGYAMGLAIGTPGGRKLIEHSGGIDGFNTHLSYYPETKLTIVVLSNIAGPAATQLAHQLGSLAFNESVTLATERKAADVPADVLKTYVGVYQLSPRVTNTVRFKDGQLTTQLSGQGQLPLFPESETKFFLKVVDAQVEFVKGDDGRISHLLLHQNGRTQKAPRISDTIAEHKEIELPRAAKEACVGTYELRPGFALEITLEGEQLMSQATGQGKIPVFPESETTFFLKVVDAQLEFTKDDKGAVTHVTLRQGGRALKGEKK